MKLFLLNLLYWCGIHTYFFQNSSMIQHRILNMMCPARLHISLKDTQDTLFNQKNRMTAHNNVNPQFHLQLSIS